MLSIKKLKKILLYFAIFLIGSSLTLAFAPFDIWPLAIICPALLLLLWENISPKEAFYRGAFFGLGFFSSGVSWVYISLHDYGQANAALAGVLTFLMIVVLLSYIAISGYLFNRFFPNKNISRYLLAFPSLWVLGELAREWVLTGFPWLFLGYSQLQTPLAGLVPIIDVFGTSWILAATAGLLVLFIRLIANWNKPIIRNQQFPNRWLIPSSISIIALWVCGFMLMDVRWTQPDGEAIQVSLIQGNIPQTLKWQADQAEKSFNTYRELTEQHWNSQLIIWPEAAVTLFSTQSEDYLEELDNAAKTHQSTLITGIPIQENNRFYNGMIALGNGSGTYLKRHLVPFGEFMPFRFLLVWLENYVQIPMSDFSRGERYQPLIQANGIPIAAFICYEIAYANEVLDALPEGKLIVVLSDDSWFGKSIASAQHLQISQMRALETGRYVLMSTNDGITAIIDAFGKIQAIVPRFEETVLTGKVQPMSGSTPWVHMGVYHPVILAMLLFLLLGWIRQKKRRIF